MAMLAVWMTSAVHMKGRKVRMVAMTSGLLVKSAGRNITMQPAEKATIFATGTLISWEKEHLLRWRPKDEAPQSNMREGACST